MSPTSLHSHQRGLSLVELMVAMVIGLIVSLAIFYTLQNFESRKRTTTSLNDIEQAGNFAMFALDRLIRSAGSGLVQGDGGLLGCSLLAAKQGTQVLPRTAALPPPFANVNTGEANVFRLIPLLIVPGAATNGSDVLVVMSGNAGYGETSSQLTANAAASELKLAGTLGFAQGDLILLAGKRGDASSPCMLTQVNATTTTTLSLVGAYHASAINGKQITSYTGGVDPDQSSNVSNLGKLGSGNSPFTVIGASDNALSGFDLLQFDSAASYPIAENVRSMYALYGIRNSDGSISWNEATGVYAPASLGANDEVAFKRLLSIKAVRIGLILRTSLLEKEEVGPSSIKLFSDLGSPVEITENIPSDERNYRYRTIESTIPLRNLLSISDQS
ncbi:hypothetical protein MASR1M42_12560 [Azonexus hydrophilus]